MAEEWNLLERKCWKFIEQTVEKDSAHDVAHIERVVKNAKTIVSGEEADPEIVVAAAWLHDCVVLPKNHPDRKKASTLAAEKAVEFLKRSDFPSNKLPAVAHAIEAHSFSAGIKPVTPEAKIVQDADRLDALGAVGIARCFSVGGQLGTAIYNPDDPFCDSRQPDDKKWVVDHFYKKLFRLPESMNTISAQKIADRRVEFMREFLQQLSEEITI